MLGDLRSGAAKDVPEGKVRGLSARGARGSSAWGDGGSRGAACRGSAGVGAQPGAAVRDSRGTDHVRETLALHGARRCRAGGTALLRVGAAAVSRGARRPLASRYFPYNEQQFSEPRWLWPGCCHGPCPARSGAGALRPPPPGGVTSGPLPARPAARRGSWRAPAVYLPTPAQVASVIFYRLLRSRQVQSGGNCSGARVWERLKPNPLLKEQLKLGCNHAGCTEDETPPWPESYFDFLLKVGSAAVARKGMLNLLSLESKQNIMPEQT